MRLSKSSLQRAKSGLFGWGGERMETVSGMECKVVSASPSLPPNCDIFLRFLGQTMLRLWPRPGRSICLQKTSRGPRPTKIHSFLYSGPRSVAVYKLKNIHAATGDRNRGCVKRCWRWNFWSWFTCCQIFWPVPCLPGESGTPDFLFTWPSCYQPHKTCL